MRSRLGSAWESAEAGGSPGAGECAGFLLPGSCSDCQCCVCLPVRCAEMFALLVNTCNFVNTINTWAEPHNATDDSTRLLIAVNKERGLIHETVRQTVRALISCAVPTDSE